MSGAGALSRGAGRRYGDCGGHRGACAIDDRRWSTAAGGFPVIGRVATGDTGRVGIRRYEGEGDTAKLPGTASGRIQGRTFKEWAGIPTRLRRCPTRTASSRNGRTPMVGPRRDDWLSPSPVSACPLCPTFVARAGPARHVSRCGQLSAPVSSRWRRWPARSGADPPGFSSSSLSLALGAAVCRRSARAASAWADWLSGPSSIIASRPRTWTGPHSVRRPCVASMRYAGRG